MSVSYRLESTSKGTARVDILNDRVYTFQYPCTSKSDCTPYIVQLGPGTYNINAYGAQGGSYYNGNGGLGGFASGTLNLSKNTQVFVYVGGQGTATKIGGTQAGGYNGGGNGQYRTGSTDRYGAGGGGASDVRILGQSFNNRIIVAGGGGGSGHGWGSTNIDGNENTGGYGGGLEGGIGVVNNGNSCDADVPSTQQGPGIASYRDWRTKPDFGIAGSATDSTSDHGASGGGGGWFGGDATGCQGFSAAGGSGYVFTSISYKPSFYDILTSEYYLQDAKLTPGIWRGDGKVNIEILKVYIPKKYHFSCKLVNLGNLRIINDLTVLFNVSDQ